MFSVLSPLAVIGVLALCSCTRLPESSVTGTWRAETPEIVKEIALRNDHTFTSWIDEKNALTTPSCPTSAGEWKLESRQIVVHFTNHLGVDDWEHEDERRQFIVVKSSRDTLQLQDPDEKRIVRYRRLFPDYVVQACTRVPLDQDVFGSWRVHYNTHDYEIVLGRDHSYGVFVNLSNSRQPAQGNPRQQLWTGAWRIENGRLLTDVKTVPSFEGESIETRRGTWSIIGIERNRIAVRDGPVRYVWQRLN